MKYLAALVVVLTVALASVHAQAQSSPLSSDLLNKLLDLDARKGTDRDIPSVIANPLGLSATGQGWASRQIAGPDLEKSVYHGFSVSRGSEQDIVFSLLRQKIGIHAFRVHRDGTLVTAVEYDLNAQRLVVLNPVEAQKELDAEFAYWSTGWTQDK